MRVTTRHGRHGTIRRWTVAIRRCKRERRWVILGLRARSPDGDGAGSGGTKVHTNENLQCRERLPQALLFSEISAGKTSGILGRQAEESATAGAVTPQRRRGRTPSGDAPGKVLRAHDLGAGQ